MRKRGHQRGGTWERERRWGKWLAPMMVGVLLFAVTGCEPFGHGHDHGHAGETNDVHSVGDHHHD